MQPVYAIASLSLSFSLTCMDNNNVNVAIVKLVFPDCFGGLYGCISISVCASVLSVGVCVFAMFEKEVTRRK